MINLETLNSSDTGLRQSGNFVVESLIIKHFTFNICDKNTMNNISQTTNHNDEIDLFELCLTLWKNKWAIITITFLSTIIATIIAFVGTKPSYQSEIKITPPFIYQIDVLNNGVMRENKDSNLPILNSVDTQSVYNILINKLNSTDLQRQFFEKNYVPKQNGTIEITQANFTNFQKKLAIRLSNKELNHYAITFTTNNPQESYELTNEFITLANEVAKNIVRKNRQAEINLLMSNLQNAIHGVKTELTATYSNEVENLQNAYEIAEKLNITTPKEVITEPYMQGTEVLANRINFLIKQKNNFSNSAEYNLLTANLSIYQNIKLPTIDAFSIYNTDTTAVVPEKPIKPNKKLIVIIGFLFGAILSVMIVLIRQAIRNRLSKI